MGGYYLYGLLTSSGCAGSVQHTRSDGARGTRAASFAGRSRSLGVITNTYQLIQFCEKAWLTA